MAYVTLMVIALMIQKRNNLTVIAMKDGTAQLVIPKTLVLPCMMDSLFNWDC